MKLTAFEYGTTEITEKMAFPGGDPQKKIPIALLFFLVEEGARKLLIDVGCDTMPGYPLYTFQSPVAVLEQYGVRREEITDVFLTHSHHDHADALRYYPQATVHLHQAALERAKKYLPTAAKLQLFDEEYRFSKRVCFRHIGGHSDGSSIALIAAEETYVLCGDECYTAENLSRGVPTGSGVDLEKSAAFVAEYRKKEYRPILFHDPDLIGAIGHKKITETDEKMINTYLFDFDGTLVDSMPTYIGAMLKILDENGIAYGDDIVKIITPLGIGGAAEYFRGLGLELTTEEIARCAKAYMLENYLHKIPAKSNVEQTLRALKSRGARLNVLTASPHVTLDACLKRLGLFDLFENVWSCEDFNTTKADPAIYRMAAERMGVAVEEVLFLDDNLNADLTAKQAGMQVCGVYDDSSAEYADEMKAACDYYIADFSELLQIREKLAGMKAAIFDMDGTLVDSLWFWEYYWSKLGERYRNDADYRPPMEVDKAVRTMTLVQVADYLHAECGLGESGEELLSFTNEMLGGFYENSVKPKDGVLEFLTELKKRGVRMCVASATAKPMVLIAMESCGLMPYFEAVFSCADLGKGKDQPDIYLQTLNYFGAPKEETWVFEDSLVAVQTAASIGLPTVGIFDRNNFGQEELRRISTHYIAEGETLEKLL